jgi:hypothetical protein
VSDRVEFYAWMRTPGQGWKLIATAYTPCAHGSICLLRDYYRRTGYATCQVKIGRGW